MSTLYVNNIEPVSGSALTLISASLIAVDDLTVTSLTSSFQGDLQGTASFATTASHALNSTSPSGVSGAIQFSDGSAFASDASNLFWDDTNKRLGVGTNAPTSRLQIVTDDATNPQAFSNQTSVLAGTASQGALMTAFSTTNGGFINALWPGNAWFKMNYGGTNHSFSVGGTVTAVIDTNTTFGNGTTSLGARLGIKGSGTTSATTSLLVQNSASANLLSVLDDGKVGVGTNVPAYKLDVVENRSGDLFGRLQNSNSGGFGMLIRAGNGASTYTMQWSNYLGVGGGRLYPDGVYIGDQSAPTARLHVKGSGTTSATTSLLVQNSSGTDIIRINDLGLLQFGGATASFPALKRVGTGLELKSADDTINGEPTFTSFNIQVRNLFYGADALSFGYSGGTTGFRISNVGASSFGVSVTDAPASAQLEVRSTTKGFLPPRMTTTQKNAISSPASGLMVYDTDLNQMSYYNGTSWVNF